jgi:outer membrane protein OmpA-like peptidoglycan-associated protein
MPNTKDLLAGTMLAGLAALQPQIGSPSATAAPLILAQQQPDTTEKRDQRERPAAQERRDQRPAGQERRDQQRPAAQERPGQPQRPAAQDAAPPQPQPQRPAAQERREEQRPAAQERREQRPAAQERPPQPQQPAAQERREPQRPAAQERPTQPAQPTVQDRPTPQQPPAAQTRPGQPQQPAAQERPTQQQPPAAQTRPGQPQQPAAQERPAQQQPPAAQTRPGQPPQPTAQERPAQQQAPAAQTRPGQPPQPTAQERPAQQQPPAAQGQPVQPPPATVQTPPAQPQPPSVQQRPGQPTAPTAQERRPDAPPPPREQARDAREFLRQDGQGPTRSIEQVRQERREVREGDRVVIREADRTIIREGGRTIIRHNETDRFAVNARDVRTERRGSETVSIVERADGTRIVTVTDEDGRLIRRSRREPSGREIVIIENDYRGPRRAESYYVELPPPVVRIPRERYIVEAERARPADIYAVLTAPPVERIDRRYTLDQVRYSAPLRERMPRVDLDTVTFDSGSWQIAPDQIDRMTVIADGLKQAIDGNPREVFLIEGHTDAVGSDVDNLSLSDRRAESVAVALTERFAVPAENLTTQGYGEQYPKVNTQAAERANRRVAVRRITPLIDQQAAETSGTR